MRILCLHGMGTNSDIMEGQIDAFRALLPRYFQYEFVDGEDDCDAAPGIGEVYPGPYLSYYNVPSSTKVDDAHVYLHSIIAEDGPFDAVMGFSQGGACAAGLVLRHQVEHPFDPPLFRFAVFLSTSLPFSWNGTYGVDASKLFSSDGGATYRSHTPSDSGDISPAEDNSPQVIMKYEMEHVRQALAIMQSSNATSNPSNVGAQSTDTQPKLIIQRFHPDFDKLRIKIPTAHIYGALDPWREQSRKLVDMCEQSVMSSYEHSGGHEVPRARDVSEKIRAVIEQVMSKSLFAH